MGDRDTPPAVLGGCGGHLVGEGGARIQLSPLQPHLSPPEMFPENRETWDVTSTLSELSDHPSPSRFLFLHLLNAALRPSQGLSNLALIFARGLAQVKEPLISPVPPQPGTPSPKWVKEEPWLLCRREQRAWSGASVSPGRSSWKRGTWPEEIGRTVEAI